MTTLPARSEALRGPESSQPFPPSRLGTVSASTGRSLAVETERVPPTDDGSVVVATYTAPAARATSATSPTRYTRRPTAPSSPGAHPTRRHRQKGFPDRKARRGHPVSSPLDLWELRRPR